MSPPAVLPPGSSLPPPPPPPTADQRAWCGGRSVRSAMTSPDGDGLMDALCFGGIGQIQLRQVPTPALQAATDALVRITLCGICGSDLHPYHGREAGLRPGTVVGHEFVGVVQAVGDEVTGVRLGDRVMAPFTACCGACSSCRGGLPCRCSHPAARVFGWRSSPGDGDGGGGGGEEQDQHELHGSQAQYVRVPLADGTLVKVPPGVSDEQALLLGDILSTAFFCAENGGVCEGSTVAVVGCGPVGLLTVLAAKHLGASKVIAVDGVASRRQMAAAFGAEAVQPDQAQGAVAAATAGRGADVALEVVGAPAALRLAFELLRPGGTLSSVGVHTAPFPFTATDAYNKNLTFRSGRCPARAYMDKLLPLVLAGTQPFTDVITHRLPLREGVGAYQMFDQKLDGCVKVVLDPWA